MRGSLLLGKYFNIKVFVHWTFLLLIFWIVLSDVQRGLGWWTIGWHILFILVLFLCVTLHEFGHALTAKRYGYNTRDIVLLPIGGLARLEEIPEKPSQELLVAIAGPIVNFIIAGVLYVIISMKGSFPDLEGLQTIGASNFLYALMFANFFIGVFNLIPAFPMDGGRILRALLGYKYPYHVATKAAVTVGQIIAVFFVLIGLLFSNAILAIIGIVIYFGAQAEVSFAQTKYFLKGYRVKDLLMHHFLKINRHDPIEKAVKMLLDGQERDFLVMDEGQVTGTLNRSELIKALSEYDESLEVWKVMNPEVTTLAPDMLLSEVLIKYKGSSALMPVVADGELLGVLDTENIMEFVKIHEAMESR